MRFFRHAARVARCGNLAVFCCAVDGREFSSRANHMDNIDAKRPVERVGSNLPLVRLGALHLAAMLAAALPGDSQYRDWSICTVLGLALAQVILSAYVATLFLGELGWRWPLSALLVALESLLAVACVSAAMPFPWEESAVLITGTLFTLWFVVQAPLWILRLRFGWRIARGEGADFLSTAGELQFGIKHILGWTAAVALMCGAGRLAFSSEALRAAMESSRAIVIFSVLAAFSWLLSILPLWAGLARDRLKSWWTLTLVYSTIIVGCQPGVISALLGERGEQSEVLWWLGFVEVASLLGSLLLLRGAGYRLMRIHR
jgi:hypothetical protein